MAGVEIPDGATLMVMLASANHDPAVHRRADTFDLTRATGRHVAFGHGPHACDGAQL
ncbi:MAG: cytochrome P450 [Catenulispora sp.]|nr:cytochrome P450 [Catenulispora sp.]